jgi:hypothetical protein
MPLVVDPRVFSPIENASSLGAKLRIFQHLFHVAQTVGPVAEVLACDRSARAAQPASVAIEELFKAARLVLLSIATATKR